MFAELLVVAAALSAAAPQATRHAFEVGERAVYDVKFGFIKAGTGAMEVVSIDTVRGRDTYQFAFTVSGGVPFYKVKYLLNSWVDTARFASLRFTQNNDEDGRIRKRNFEIFPEELRWSESVRGDSGKSVADPLDDASFLYFVRTLDLEVGKSYSYDRYFKPESNPVTLKVLRRERVSVPAGKFNAIVVQPIIKTRGIFSEGGRAQVWFTDDSARMVVKIESRLAFGSLHLELKTYQPRRLPQ